MGKKVASWKMAFAIAKAKSARRTATTMTEDARISVVWMPISARSVS